MRILVCGDRNWTDQAAIWNTLDKYLEEWGHDNLTIIQGDAPGADMLAKMWAEDRAVDHESYPARWKIHHRSAGPQRNMRMILVGVPDLVLAFHDHLETDSRGTIDMWRKAKRHKIKRRHIHHKRPR